MTTSTPGPESASEPTPTLRVETETAIFEVYASHRTVITRFDDTHYAEANRVLDDPLNMREAVYFQGYRAQPPYEAVWRALVEHELLHSVVAETLWGTRSRVLSTEAGVGAVPSWLRHEEEAVVLAFQAYTNGIEEGTLYSGPLTVLPSWTFSRLVASWHTKYRPQLAGLWQQCVVSPSSAAGDKP